MNIKKLIPILAFFAGSALLRAEEYKDNIAQGDEAYKKYDLLTALKLYEQAAKTAPDDYAVMLRLSRTYNDVGEELYEIKKKDESEQYITKALEISKKFQKMYPDSAASYNYLAMSYGQMAIFKGGEEKIKFAYLIEENAKKAIKLKPGWYFPYMILGIYYRQLAGLNWFERLFASTFFGDVPDGSYEDSEKMFRKALSIEPQMVVGAYQLSKTYRDQDMEQEEIAMLKRTLKHPIRDFRDKYSKAKAKLRLAELTE